MDEPAVLGGREQPAADEASERDPRRRGGEAELAEQAHEPTRPDVAAGGADVPAEQVEHELLRLERLLGILINIGLTDHRGREYSNR